MITQVGVTGVRNKVFSISKPGVKGMAKSKRSTRNPARDKTKGKRLPPVSTSDQSGSVERQEKSVNLLDHIQKAIPSATPKPEIRRWVTIRANGEIVCK